MSLLGAGYSGVRATGSTLNSLLPRLGYSRKKGYGSARKGRVLKIGLAKAGGWETRQKALRVRGRDGHEHFADAPLRMGTNGKGAYYFEVPPNFKGST